MQEVIFFFDDSGVFHQNEPTSHFVYAGYVFTDKEELAIAKRKYINANRKIKRKTGRMDELKAANITNNQKRALFNSTKKYDSVAVIVDLKKIYSHILANKKSRCRYKDYILKRCVKNKLIRLINEGKISKDEDIKIKIYIDEQLTATNGYYDLRDSIKEELQHGIINFDYACTHQRVFNAEVDVSIQYCDSSNNYMIQASDILANRIWASFKNDNSDLRNIENHLNLTFP